MVSEFRKKKILHVFKHFDINSSGTINEEDFDLTSYIINEKQKWGKDSLKHKEIQKALANIWDSLHKVSDSDGDGEITLEEWYDMWEQFAKNPSSPFEWQSQYCKLTFDVLDASGDGALDSEEYSMVSQLFGISKEDSEGAFQKMANGKSSISWEDFQQLWKEYFNSENPNDPGNFIFGLRKFCR